MKRKRQRVIELIFSRPTSANIQWRDIEALFIELGADVEERAGSRVSVAGIRKWLEQHGVEP
ncbi:MAG: hexulose-6-phosphate synthase [Rhodoferax sp.]